MIWVLIAAPEPAGGTNPVHKNDLLMEAPPLTILGMGSPFVAFTAKRNPDPNKPVESLGGTHQVCSGS
jgi:hypothetical protein